MAEKYIIYLTFRKVKGLPCDGNSGISEGSIQYTQYSSELSARLSAQLLRFILIIVHWQRGFGVIVEGMVDQGDQDH